MYHPIDIKNHRITKKYDFEAKQNWRPREACSFSVRSSSSSVRPESNCFLRRGNGGVDTARRRWRFDTSIFRISKVDRPYKWLRNSICRSRDPFLDHLFAHFLNLWKPPNWRWWRQIEIKVQFDDSLEPNSQCIYDQCIPRFYPFRSTNCASRSCRARCI